MARGEPIARRHENHVSLWRNRPASRCDCSLNGDALPPRRPYPKGAHRAGRNSNGPLGPLTRDRLCGSARRVRQVTLSLLCVFYAARDIVLELGMRLPASSRRVRAPGGARHRLGGTAAADRAAKLLDRISGPLGAARVLERANRARAAPPGAGRNLCPRGRSPPRRITGRARPCPCGGRPRRRAGYHLRSDAA